QTPRQRSSQGGGSLKKFAIPAQRPAAPHRDQPRGVERIDHEDHDRQVQKCKAQRERDRVEGGQPERTCHRASSNWRRCIRSYNTKGTTSSSNNTTAAADATRQHLLVK